MFLLISCIAHQSLFFRNLQTLVIWLGNHQWPVEITRKHLHTGHMRAGVFVMTTTTGDRHTRSPGQ